MSCEHLSAVTYPNIVLHIVHAVPAWGWFLSEDW